MTLYLFFALSVMTTAGLLCRWDGSDDGRGFVKALIWGAFWMLGAGGAVIGVSGWAYWPVLPVILALCTMGQAAPTGPGLRMGRNSKNPALFVINDVTQRDVAIIEYPQFFTFYKRGADGIYDRRWISSFWYDFLYMTVKGFLAVSGAVAAFSLINLPSGALMAFAAPLSALAYEAGWRMYPNHSGKRFIGMTEATQIGEAFRGVAAGLCFVAAMAVM